MTVDLKAENQRLREQVEELRFTIAELRGDAGVMELQNHFKISPGEAKVLAFMSDGRVHTKNAIMQALGHEDYESSTLASVYISKLRSKAGMKIETLWGNGWKLVDARHARDVMKGGAS